MYEAYLWIIPWWISGTYDIVQIICYQPLFIPEYRLALLNATLQTSQIYIY